MSPPPHGRRESISSPTSFSSVQFIARVYLGWTLLGIIFFLRSL